MSFLSLSPNTSLLQKFSQLLVCTFGLSFCASAQAQTPAPQDPKALELKQAWQDADRTGTRGPATVPLLDQADLQLPANYFYVPAAAGTRIMKAFGNRVNPQNFNGLIVSTNEKDNWVVVVNFVKEGYVRDGDAKEWNADELLTSLREGTEEANKDRAAKGFPEMQVLGWVEKPAYDAQTHRLVWSLSYKNKGDSDSANRGVNYNTYALGRDGYFSLNLLTDQASVEAQKPIAKTLLSSLAYKSGKRYEDFNESTDHVAAYGLAALVGVVAAKKLGLLAVAGLFLLKFAKLFAIAAAGFGVALAKAFGFRRKQKAAAAAAATPAPYPPTDQSAS